MKATIGRIVTVQGIFSNGVSQAPAIITRSYSSQDTRSGPVAVNLCVFPDNAPPERRTSVMLFETEDQARAYRGGGLRDLIVAHWPSREDDSADAPFPPLVG